MRLHPKLTLEYENHPQPHYVIKVYRYGDLATTISTDAIGIEPEKAFTLAKHVFDAVCLSYRELSST